MNKDGWTVIIPTNNYSGTCICCKERKATTIVSYMPTMLHFDFCDECYHDFRMAVMFS